MSDFFRKHGLIISKEGRISKKIFHNRAKNIHPPENVGTWKHAFLDIKKSDSKRLFSSDSKCRTITRG